MNSPIYLDALSIFGVVLLITYDISNFLKSKHGFLGEFVIVTAQQILDYLPGIKAGNSGGPIGQNITAVRSISKPTSARKRIPELHHCCRSDQEKSIREGEKRLEKARKHLVDRDVIIRRLYENSVRDNLSMERYRKPSEPMIASLPCKRRKTA